MAKTRDAAGRAEPATEKRGPGRIITGPDREQCLDTIQLHQLEQSFRVWAAAATRADVRQSRRRILLIFLLIRFSGAKLNEVLALDPFADIDYTRQVVSFGRVAGGGEDAARQVHVPEELCLEMAAALNEPGFKDSLQKLFDIDPAFVRRKFYERATACGFAKRLGGPEAIRKARAVELMQGNMPLPAVQMLLGHSTPNLTSAYVAFSDKEILELTRFHLARESARKTSARNAFFGKIGKIRQGDIQSLVELLTLGGHIVVAMITNDSMRTLCLQEGVFATAEVKAPWVTLHQGGKEPACSAENRYRGVITRVIGGKINAEYVVRLGDGTELCAIAGSPDLLSAAFKKDDPVWALFNSFAVVLHLD